MMRDALRDFPFLTVVKCPRRPQHHRWVWSDTRRRRHVLLERMGAAIGAKLGAPDKPVVGLVGDGSLYYSDSALWTAASHSIPVLYVISNNGAYGIVAGAFGGADADMKRTGEYRGVVLDNIDPVKLSEGFGVEAMHATDESKIADVIEHGLKTVEEEKRPFLLNVHLPIGLPQGGRPGAPYSLKDDMS